MRRGRPAAGKKPLLYRTRINTQSDMCIIERVLGNADPILDCRIKNKPYVGRGLQNPQPT